MLQLLSKVQLADNSGVISGRVIKVLTPKNSKLATLGGLVLISAKINVKNSNILPGSKFKALIVRSRYPQKTMTNNYKWNENAVVLVKLAPKNVEYLPIGTRIKGSIPSNLLRLHGYQKVVALTKHFV